MRPYEETWTNRVYRGEVQLDGDTIGWFGEGNEAGEAFMLVRARTQLASQAPAMARMLLRGMEVVAAAEENYHTCLGGCGGYGPTAKDHGADCALVAVLRAAGALA